MSQISRAAEAGPHDDLYLAVAVLGLGRMGTAIAQRLTDQDWTVTGWTRSGGTEPSAVVRQPTVVVLALFDGPACAQVIDRCGAALTPDTVVVNTTTVAPDEATALEKTVHATGAGYVHAPVMGSVPAVRSRHPADPGRLLGTDDLRPATRCSPRSAR